MVDFFQAGDVDVSVDLGGGHVDVAEHFLNGAEIGTAGEQVSGETVAKRVGG